MSALVKRRRRTGRWYFVARVTEMDETTLTVSTVREWRNTRQPSTPMRPVYMALNPTGDRFDIVFPPEK